MVIPPRKNAKPWKPTSAGAIARNDAVNAQRYLGRTMWRRWSGYHRRSRVETKMHCMKLLGQSLMARKSKSVSPSSTATPVLAYLSQRQQAKYFWGKGKLTLRPICAIKLVLSLTTYRYRKKIFDNSIMDPKLMIQNILDTTVEPRKIFQSLNDIPLYW